jgi:hypothetical protein
VPLDLTTQGTAAASLADFTAALDQTGFDPADAESLAYAADWLARLGRNETFLGDLLIAELAAGYADSGTDYGYGPQVLLLRGSPAGHLLRANLWPAQGDPMLRASGPQCFAYGLPHDHNFAFLTCGYLGPGYWSDHYEYDAAAVTGWVGEPVPSLRYTGRSRLGPGQLLLYRANLDVHVQHAPAALSVSLNLLEASAVVETRDQFAFDLDQRTIARRLNSRASEAFLQIAVATGTSEALDLAEWFAGHHRDDRMRLSAWQALAGVSLDPGEVWGRAEASGSLLVRQEAQRRRRLEQPAGQGVQRGLQDHGSGGGIDSAGALGAAHVLGDQAAFGAGG